MVFATPSKDIYVFDKLSAMYVGYIYPPHVAPFKAETTIGIVGILGTHGSME